MGVFTSDISSRITKIKKTYKNDYNKDVATLVIDGVEYVDNEYSRTLADYTKYKSQYDELAKRKREAESTIAYSKLTIDITKEYHEAHKDMDKKVKSDDIVGMGEDKRKIAEAEDTLKEVTSAMAQIERKYKGVKAILNEYGKHGEQIIAEGVYHAKNIKLLVSDKQFCRYLMMHEFENVNLTDADDLPKAHALLYDNIKRLSADFNTLFPKFIGREQSRRVVQTGINPLNLILINGKRLAEYAFTDTKFPWPEVGGKKVSLEDMADNATGAAFMKARFMAALIANRDDIRILSIRNAENNFEIDRPFKLSVDMSDYEEVEKAWLIENKNNVGVTKKHICQFTDSKVNITDEELEEKAKNESGYKKKGLDEEQKKQFVEEYKAKAREKQAKTYAKATEESIKLINKKYSTKADDLAKKRTKEEIESIASRDKLRAESDATFQDKSFRDEAGYETAIKEGRMIKIQPLDDATKNFMNDIAVFRQSYRFVPDTSKSFEILTKKITDEYYAAKEEAERCLKIHGMAKAYDLLKLRVSNVFQMSALLNDYRVASTNIEKDLKNTAVLTFNIDMYVKGVTNLISGVSKVVDEMTHLRKGSYLTLNDEIAYKAEGDKEEYLNGNILSPEERKEYFALLTKFKETEVNVRARIEKVLGFYSGLGNRSTTDFIDVYNGMKNEIDIDQLELDIKRFSDLTGKLLYESNGEKFPEELLESKKYGREVDRLVYINEVTKAKDAALSRFGYVRDLAELNYYHLSGNIIFNATWIPLVRVKVEQDAKIATINAKKADEVTDEEKEFIKNSISANYAKLTEIEEERDKVTSLLLSNPLLDDHQKDNTEELESEIMKKFPPFFDKESVKAEYANKPVEEENKNVINEAPEFTDEDFERVMNRVAASGIHSFSSENGNIQFQKRLDEAVEHYVKVMTESEKKDLQKTVNTWFMKHVPAELKVEFGKTDFFNKNIGGAALERADAVYKAEIDKLNDERKTARDTVSQLNIEVSRIAYQMETQGEEVAYWEGREKLVDEMVYIANEFKALDPQYKALLEEHKKLKKLNEHIDKVIEASGELASELYDMDNILNPKSGWSGSIKMGDLKKLVYPREALEVDVLVLDGPDKEAEKTRLNAFNENREFKPADSFEQSMQIAGVKKDRHPEAGNFKDYDKLTIDQFMTLYLKVSDSYPNTKAFETANPYMQARFKSINRFYGNVEAEREFRKKAFDLVNGMRIDRYAQLVTNDENMTAIGQRQYAYSNKLSNLFYQYERNGDVILDRDFMDDEFANLDVFLGKADRIKAKIVERKTKAQEKNAEFKEALKAKENELISWTKKSEELAKAAPCEYKREAVEKLVADYEKIKKESVNNFVIDKILTKRKAELDKENEPKAVVQDTVKDYQTRYDDMKARYYSELGRFTVNEGGKVYKEIASHVRSEVFAKNMSVLYKLSEDKDKFNNPGHELDDMKLINDRRIMASKLYVNVVKELSKSDILGKNYNFESDYAKLKDTIRNRYKLYTTGEKSTQNIKNFMAKIKKPTLDNLYDGVYPYVFKYVTSYNKLKDFLVAEVIGKNKYEPDAAVKEIAQFEKDAKLCEGTKKNYETFKKLLSECPENDRKEILMTIMTRKEPKFNNDDLKCVDKLCRDIADEEIRAQVGIVNQSLGLNMDLIDKKSAEFSKAELIKLQQQQEKELKKLMEQADKEREKQLKESQKQAEAQKNGPHK